MRFEKLINLGKILIENQILQGEAEKYMKKSKENFAVDVSGFVFITCCSKESLLSVELTRTL